MLQGIKSFLKQRELKRQETIRKQAEAREREAQQRLEQQRRELEEQRQQHELRQKILAMLEEGKVPDLNVSVDVPFRLLKNERYLLAGEGVNYAEIRTKREIVGRSAGTSVRVMKGVSLRAGASKGTRVESDVLTPRGSGTFAISTRHVFFHGERSFRIPLGKIVSVRRDGVGDIEIVRDRASAQPEYFGTFSRQDADFIVQLIHLLPTVDFGRGEPDIQPVESYILPGDEAAGDDLLDQE